MSKIIGKAYGKINLTLDVLGQRDDGYHEIITLLQGINLYDLVHLTPQAVGIEITCNLPALASKENLAYQAANLLTKNYPQITGLRIHLEKNIPLAAGLGGGSADAAMVLWGCNYLFDLGLSLSELASWGACIGSDVPFCLYPLTAIGTGRGEKLTYLPPCPQLELLLLKPPFLVSTREVYQYLAAVDIKKRPQINTVIKACQTANKAQIYAGCGNVLQKATFALYPQLKEWVRQIEDSGVKKVIMAGSGPTLIVFEEEKEKIAKLITRFSKPGWQVEVVRTLNSKDLRGRMIISD